MTTPIQKLMSLKLGQTLLIETNGGELLVGTLKHINTKYLMIELDNVRDIKTNYTYQSTQILAYTQIQSIKLVLNENDTTDQSESTETETDSDCLAKQFISLSKKTESCNLSADTIATGTSPLNSSKEESEIINIQLTELDLQLLQTQLNNTTFITQTDHKYHKSLKDIKTQSVIGLLIDPIQMGRNSKTSLIAVSTPHNIYLFDILSLGKIFKEIRLILESERPRKAVHYSHKMVDHLKFRHNLLLKGIFDTFVAYCVVTGKKNSLSLEETIQKTFNISNTYFEADLESNVPVNCYQRPLSHEHRTVIAKKAAFQLKLYDHLLHESMLKNFYLQCQRFSETFCNDEDNFEVAQQLHPRSRVGYEHIQPNGSWRDKLDIELEFSLKNQ